MVAMFALAATVCGVAVPVATQEVGGVAIVVASKCGGPLVALVPLQVSDA